MFETINGYIKRKIILLQRDYPICMKKYKCTICGYIYDPVEGDPDGGIMPGTLFEDIPDDWFCPVCGVSKAEFEPVD